MGIKKLIGIFLVVASTRLAMAEDGCNSWNLAGTFFQPENKALADWIPKELFDRTITSVDSVVNEDRGSIAIVTLDRKLPNAGGSAKVVIDGKSYCFRVLLPGNAPFLSLGNQVKLIWADKDQNLDAKNLKDKFIVLSLKKRD